MVTILDYPHLRPFENDPALEFKLCALIGVIMITTLYANTSRVGWIIAGSVDGIMVEIWSYHALFWLAIGMLGIAMICLLFIKDI